MGYRIISTVVSPAESTELVALQTVKEDLGISYDDSSANSLLSRYIRYASKAAQEYCNRIFARETIKDEFFFDAGTWPPKTGPHAGALSLSKHPVISVASVTENASALTANVDFRVDKENGLLSRVNFDGLSLREFAGWPVVVTYDAGFATVPEDVEDACLRMIRARYISRQRDPNIRSESIPGVRDVSYWVATGSDAANMTPDIEDLLDNYRVPVLS